MSLKKSPKKALVPHQGTAYDNIAQAFANMRDSFAYELPYLDTFIRYLPEKASILDIGCGSGFPIASYLLAKNFTLTGIDASKKLLSIAAKNCPSMTLLQGDVRTISLNQYFDAVIEWWCLFHLPKQNHEAMLARFAAWLKPGGILEFTTGDRDYEHSNSDMLKQKLYFYSLDPNCYEQYLKKYGFKLLLKESDQDYHLVWIAQKNL